MSCKELIDSLRKAADERVLSLRQEAEREAGAAKADVARRLEERRADADRKRDVARREAIALALSAANNRARQARLTAEQALSARLKDAAAASLRALRGDGYEAVFEQLFRELPALSWKTVRVNPDDVALAKKYFSGAEVVSDPAVTGGMDASAPDGSVRIINTFDKRLERAWSDMLPLMIQDVYREIGDGTPETS